MTSQLAALPVTSQLAVLPVTSQLATLPVTSQLVTLRDWLVFAEDVYERAGLALGQIATSAHDEALYLLLRTLGWPLDSDASALERRIEPAQRIKLREVLRRRVVERVPAAYITREAFLGGNRYYVDERVLIPRSYFLELIPGRLDLWLPDGGKKVRRVADVCTGSGCLAIELAHHFPKARVDAIDLSPDALEVAKINVRAHNLTRRVNLYRSDVFDALPPPGAEAKAKAGMGAAETGMAGTGTAGAGAVVGTEAENGKYDMILSNPPYEPSKICDKLPEEFQKEPRLALDGGKDGLDIIRKLLAQARERIAPHGIVVIEAGGLRRAMERTFGGLGLHWLRTKDGSDCVCLAQAKRLQAARF
ncbi:MAG: HemK family protein methyltransferase [Opitutaceae bacterium]|nr:HemK family protein methyltransferase [Opitutaceae bacterium]